MFPRRIDTYLQGLAFSNGVEMDLSRLERGEIVFRDTLLCGLAEGKRVLHLGFLDHLPLLEEKLASGTWLHRNLVEVSRCCYGVDLSREGVEYARKRTGCDHLFAVDLVADELPGEIRKGRFDYLFIPDVIEHVGDPVSFLAAVRRRLGERAERVVVTAPNAFRLDNFLNVLKGVEVINSDHRFWFTPYTLSKVLADAGFRVDSLMCCEHGSLSPKKRFKRKVLERYPLLRDTIFVTATAGVGRREDEPDTPSESEGTRPQGSPLTEAMKRG